MSLTVFRESLLVLLCLLPQWSPGSSGSIQEVSFSLCHRETRLEEALEKLCERILDYSVHAERKGSLRYAKVSLPRGGHLDSPEAHILSSRLVLPHL